LDGYIKLYRKLLENPVFQNDRLLKVFIWCLLKASYKEHEQLLGLHTVQLQPGQFIYGRFKASQELKIKPSTLNDQMNTLKRLQIIDIKPNNKYSIVTLANWTLYQSNEEASDNKTDSKATTNQQQTDTNKKGKKGNNKYSSDFEKFYALYPNPFNKMQTFKNWEALLKKGETTERIMTATNNYLQYIKSNEIDSQYITRSTNFIGRKGDYLGYIDMNSSDESNDWRWKR